MNLTIPPVSIGWIIALIVLVLVVVIAVVTPGARNIELLLIGLLALARLL